MNKFDWKSILYIVLGVLALVVFFKILPYLIFGAIITYVVFKIVRYFKDKTDNVRFENSSSYAARSNDKVHMEDDMNTNEAIDVDYKDV